MTPLPNPRRSPDELEKFVDRVLRDLPAKRAPRSLEQRVLAELARRSALPWWRQSFSYWPLPIRGAFLAGCIVLIGFIYLAAGAGQAMIPWQGALAQPLAFWDATRAVFGACTGFVDVVLRNIPALWLWGALAFFATMYGTLLGLGAAAFKALNLQLQLALPTR